MFKNFKASILVVTMMILGIILTVALSVSIVSLKERKASIGSSSSSKAYQVADTGIEKVMDAILTNRDSGSIVSGLAGFSCEGGVAKVVGPGYKVELKKDNSGTEVPADCSARLADVVAIKSVGISGQTQRAIEAAVAAINSGTWCGLSSSNAGNRETNYVDGSTSATVILCEGVDPTVSCPTGYRRFYTSPRAWADDTIADTFVTCIKN